ncbi:MAG: hypothetical protein M0P71_01075 [Melioribacteraceae bacterium]|nr:hypothetical protein [Melioribacteraceae bacterium]
MINTLFSQEWIHTGLDVIYEGKENKIISVNREESFTFLGYKGWVTLSNVKDENDNYIRIPITKISLVQK